MGIRFRKSIKINDLLKLNVSKTGVSLTAGKKGASINLGKGGTFLNLGLAGTGLSYRQKITGGYKDVVNKVLGKDNKKKTKSIAQKEIPEELELDTSIIDNYNEKHEAIVNIHKYTGNVLSKEDFNNNLDKIEDVDAIVNYKKCIVGDEDTIEDAIGEFNSNLQLDYEVNVSYELEDHDLYVDLDLPEIENLDTKYPEIVKNKIVEKDKTNAMLKEEYANLVMSLGVFLSINYFNISSYIDQVILSSFTQKRNSNGEKVDEYLYSVKFERESFEKTDFEKINDLYSFIDKFDSRINFSNNSFKAIKPFEMESKVQKDEMIEEALSALKSLGYKDLNNIKEELLKQDFKETQEYLKFALKNIQK